MFRPSNRHEGRPWQLFWDSHNGNLTVSCLLISREACENGNGIAFIIFGGLDRDTAGGRRRSNPVRPTGAPRLSEGRLLIKILSHLVFVASLMKALKSLKNF